MGLQSPFKQDVEQLEKKSKGKWGKRVDKIIWELEKLLCLHKLEAQCVYSTEKMDVEVIFNQTDMATTRVMDGSTGQMKSEENMKHTLSSKGK